MAADNIATLGIKVDPRGAVSGANKAKRAIKGIGVTAKRVKDTIFSLNGALGVLGAGAMLRSALKYASSIESLKVQLKFLTGSAKDAGKAFDYMLGFAKQAPFTLKEIQKASPSLLTVTSDVDELNSLLEITGDIAASSSLSFQEVAQQLQKTFAGGISAADQFRDSGIKAMLGFETGVKYSAEESKKHILKLWSESTTSMKGATKDMALTFEGQVSMMGDAWDELQLAFMKEGVFDETKTGVKDITDMLRDPETVKTSKELGQAVTQIGLALKDTVQTVNSLPTEVTSVGLVLFLLGGAKARVAIATLTALAVKIDDIRKAIRGISSDDVRLQFNGLNTAELEDARDAQIKIYSEIQQKIKDVKAEMNEAAVTGDDSVFWKKNEELGELNVQAKTTTTTISTLIDMMKKQRQVANDVTAPKQYYPTNFEPPKANKVGTNAQLKDARAIIKSVYDYKDSLSQVGVQVSALQKLENAYTEQKKQLAQAIEDGGLSNTFEASQMEAMAVAYDEARERIIALSDPMAKLGEQIDGIFGTEGSLVSGLGNAVAQMVVFGKKGSDVFKALGRQIFASVISALVEWGIKSAMVWAKEALFKTKDAVTTVATEATKTTAALTSIGIITGASVASGVAVAAAWTPAAAMVSLASFGANSAPAIAGITAANASAQAMRVASFEGGGFTGSGSRSGGVDGKGGFPAILHPNETVIDHTKSNSKQEQQEVRNVTAEINFNVQAIDSSSFNSYLVNNSGTIEGIINSSLSSNGSVRRTIKQVV